MYVFLDFRRTVRKGRCVNVKSENAPFDVSDSITTGCFDLGSWLCGAQLSTGCQTLIRATFTPV